MGKKPDRPPSGFSDALWYILLAAWDADYGSRPSKRPPIQSISNQLKEDADRWDEFIILPTEKGDESCTSSVDLGTRENHLDILHSDSPFRKSRMGKTRR